MALPGSAFGQDVRFLTVADSSSVSISGSSNQTDWSVKASEFSGSFEVVGSGSGLAVRTAEISVVSRSIRSDRGIIMTRLMGDALKVAAHPAIVFSMTEVVSTSVVDGAVQLTALGDLKLAGAENPIEILVSVAEVAGGVRFSGSVEFDMTDWKIKPPTAMFGALRTGKVVTVAFDVLGVPEG